MSYGKDQAAAGRKLVSLRQKMAGANAYEMSRLRAQAIRLLFQLGNAGAAMEEARILCGEQPDKAYSWMAFGDASANAGAWAEALDAFLRAAQIRRKGGLVEDAVRTELGPAYRTAEGLGDFKQCLALTSSGGLLGETLRSRTMRLMGRESHLPAAPVDSGFLVEGLHILEASHRGAKPYRLPDLVIDWGPSEPEWRWRLFAEGVLLYRDNDLAFSPWKKALPLFEENILDPRFHGDKKVLRKFLLPGTPVQT